MRPSSQIERHYKKTMRRDKDVINNIDNSLGLLSDVDMLKVVELVRRHEVKRRLR